jgi:VWFA-related protein
MIGRHAAPRLLLLPLLGAVSVAAQQPVFRTAIDSVTVDVSVQQRGRPVTDLTAADFELRDNNVVQQIGDVSREALPIDVTLIVDLSSSVEGPLLASLTRAVDAIGAELRPTDRAQIITFSERIHQALALSPAGGRLSASLGPPQGLTSLIDAVAVSVIAPTDPDRRRMAIVFTDGRDMTSFLDESSTIEVARRSGMTVFAVAVTGGTQRVKQPAANAKFFEALTADTGGEFAVLQRDEDLGQTFVRAVQDFRTSYVLRYVVSPGLERRGWHDLSVKVTRRGTYEVRARKGYFGN